MYLCTIPRSHCWTSSCLPVIYGYLSEAESKIKGKIEMYHFIMYVF